jgi:hypothetical protein
MYFAHAKRGIGQADETRHLVERAGAMQTESVFEKRHAARLTSVAMAAIVMRVSATAVSCS